MDRRGRRRGAPEQRDEFRSGPVDRRSRGPGGPAFSRPGVNGRARERMSPLRKGAGETEDSSHRNRSIGDRLRHPQRPAVDPERLVDIGARTAVLSREAAVPAAKNIATKDQDQAGYNRSQLHRLASEEQLIAATTSKTGLEVRCELDEDKYPAGVKIADEDLAAVDIVRHEFHGEWNYTIWPRTEALQH